METCVVVSHHPRNYHHHNNHHHHHHGRSGRSGFSSSYSAGSSSSGLYFSPPPPSRAFRGINCRTALQSGAGILPPPLSAFRLSSSSSTTSSSPSPSPSPPSSPASSPRSRTADLPSPRSEPPPRRQQQPSRRSSPIPITTKRTTSLPSQSTISSGGASLLPEFNSTSPNTELWAGPAYSNSPPPSSLPIPKFSLRGKRSASLDLPPQLMDLEELRPMPKSAPASPSRESGGGSSPPASRFFTDAFASATWDLCRMLNLNLDED